jgi:uncharacterized protein (TIGR04255 family)
MPRSDPSRAAAVHRHRYDNPPVIERIVEVHVIPGNTSLSTAKDALALRWVDYGIIEQMPLGSVQFELNVADNFVQTTQQSDTRLRFWRSDKKRLYQVARELFVANDLLPEPGWEDLQPMFRTGYRDFLEILQPRSVVKGVLRYMNRVKLPADATGQDLFTIFPTLPGGRQREGAPFRMVVDMGDTGAGPSLLVLAFTGSEAEPQYALDLAVESRRPLDTPESAFAWADQAHDRMTELFESSITSRARTLFKERS